MTCTRCEGLMVHNRPSLARPEDAEESEDDAAPVVIEPLIAG